MALVLVAAVLLVARLAVLELFQIIMWEMKSMMFFSYFYAIGFVYALLLVLSPADLLRFLFAVFPAEKNRRISHIC